MRAPNSTNTAPKHALIIDYHALLRTGLTSLVKKIDSTADVKQAANAQDALNHLYTDSHYDLIILDINLPDMDGCELLHKIKTNPASADAAIIITSSIHDQNILDQIEKLGVQCILPKSTPNAKISQHIQAILQPEATRKNNNSLTKISRSKKPLNKRQLQILRYLSQGMSNREISQTIFLSEGTIKNHITQIFNYLEVSNRTQAIIEAEKHNLTRRSL